MSRSALLAASAALLMTGTAGAATRAQGTTADLAVAKLSVSPASVVAGGTVTVSETTRNGGAAAARASHTAYLLSANARRDGRDKVLGSRRVAALKGRKSARGKVRLTIPATTPAGRYRLLACSDDRRRTKERNERNNCRAANLTVTRRGTAPPIATPTPAPQPSPTTTPAPTPTAPPVDPAAAPAITKADPGTGSDTAATRLSGTTGANTTVHIFKNSQCAGTSVATGSAADFTGAGIEVAVDQGKTTPFTAHAVKPGAAPSACSAPFAFEEVAKAEVEPNDTIELADAAAADHGVIIDRGRMFSGAFASDQNLDEYRLQLAQPARVRVTIRGPGGGDCAPAMDPAAFVIDAQGITLAYDDDESDTSRCPDVAITLPAGRYYVVAAPTTQQASSYELTATFGPAAIAMTTSPPSPSPDTAPRLIGNATPGATVDVFKKAGCTGDPVASGTAAQFASPGLTVPVTAGELAPLFVRATLGEASTCSERALLYENAAIPLESEPNDTIAEADTLAPATLTGGRIDPDSEADHFAFTPTAAGTVRFETTTPECFANDDSELTLLDADGDELASNDDLDLEGGNYCSRIDYPVTAGTTYYLKVAFTSAAPAGSRRAFPYRLIASPAP